MNKMLDRIERVIALQERAPLQEQVPAPGMVPKEEKRPRSWNYADPFSTFGSVSGYSSYIEINQELTLRYQDYDAMGEYPELHTSLDIYADDATKLDLNKQHRVWVDTENQALKKELEDLLYERVKVDHTIRNTARTLAQYGNDFAEIMYDSTAGVTDLYYPTVPSMRVIEDVKGFTIGYAQDLQGSGVIDPKVFVQLLQAYRENKIGPETKKPFEPFESWEMIHWALKGHHRTTYGYSLLEPARWAWRRLVLLEDSAIVFKLTRSPARFVFYVDVTGKSPPEAAAYLQRAKNQFLKKKFVTPEGKLDFRASPLSMDESIWVPSSNGKDSTRIDMLSGAEWQAVDDLEYFRQKLISAMKMLPSYMGTAEGDNRSSLAQQDIRFASSVEYLQTMLLAGYTKLCRYHLMVKGMDPDQAKWRLAGTPVSTLNELAQIEARAAKADLASRLENYLPRSILLTQILGYSESEAAEYAKKMSAQKIADGKIDAQIQAEGQKMMNDVTPQEEAIKRLIGLPKNRLDEKVNQEILKILREDRKAKQRVESRDIERLREEIVGLRKELRRNTLLGSTPKPSTMAPPQAVKSGSITTNLRKNRKV